jgi:hypothetical protein
MRKVKRKYCPGRLKKAKAFSMAWALLFWGCSAFAQQVYFSRYVGLNYLEDKVHRLDLFNPGQRSIDLSGYLLVSRQYVAKFPKATLILPRTTFSLGKRDNASGPVDLPFESIQDFLIRIPKGSSLGDYLILFSPEGKIVDAFYFSPTPEVTFLPDQGALITFDNQRIPFSVPSEQHPAWRYLQVAPDPALAFLRIGDVWQPSARNRNVLPATEYASLQAKYVQGIVTIMAETRYERDCLPHQLERSTDGKQFSPIHRFEPQGNELRGANYQYYDNDVSPGGRYVYRMKNQDKFGFTVFSNLVEVLTDDLPEDFGMEILQTSASEGVSLRVSSRQARKVRIKILDQQFRELALLFFDQLPVNSQRLIRYEASLPSGKYYLVADAGLRRVYQTFIIGEGVKE